MTQSKHFLGLCALVTLGFICSPAAAQTAPSEGVTSAPSERPNDAPPSVPPAPNLAAPPPVCRLGTHAGIPEEDASTASSLVCREVEAKAPASGHNYRVDLDRLGNTVYLTLSDEAENGANASRRMRLSSIEETGDAAPRLASALLEHKSVGETAQSDNLTEAEARAPLRKSGALQYGVGVLGAYAPGVATLAPGFELGLRYDTLTWVAHTTLRYAGRMDEGKGLRLFDWGVGARYMLGKGDVSPFVGGGMAFVALERNSQAENGLGAFGEVGVEMLRLHKSHLGATLRADAPLFKVASNYAVPLSLSVNFTF